MTSLPEIVIGNPAVLFLPGEAGVGFPLPCSHGHGLWVEGQEKQGHIQLRRPSVMPSTTTVVLFSSSPTSQATAAPTVRADTDGIVVASSFRVCYIPP